MYSHPENRPDKRNTFRVVNSGEFQVTPRLVRDYGLVSSQQCHIPFQEVEVFYILTSTSYLQLLIEQQFKQAFATFLLGIVDD